MAKWIKVSGEVTEVSPANGTDFSLEELQGFVGGYIELLPVGVDELLVINEEGKLIGLPPNAKATEKVRYVDLIVGDVLLCNDRQVR